MPRTLIKNGTVISPTGVEPADVLIDGETIAAVGAPGSFADGEPGVRQGHRRRRQVRAPGRHRRAHAHGAAVRRHVRLRHVRDRHARGRVGRCHHDRRHRACSAPARTCTTGLAEWHRKADGECAIDYGVPPDHRRRRRRVAEVHEVPHRARGRHQLQAVHGVPRRASTATTARSSGRCRRPRSAAR